MTIFKFRSRKGGKRLVVDRVEFRSPLPGGSLPLRSGFTPHEVLLHFGLFLGSVITLCGASPALASHIGASHPVFFIVISSLVVLGCGSTVTGIMLRRATGSLWALLIELLGLIIAAGAETAYASFSLVSAPSHNYTSYTFLFCFALANLWRSRQIKVDLEEARKVAPK